MRSALIWLLALAICTSAGFDTLAQVPTVVPGFPSTHVCTPGQLLDRQVGLGRTTNIIYHNGRLYSNDVGGGGLREYLFTTPSNPASFQISASTGLPPISDHGNHGSSKSGDYAGGTLGFFHRRLSPGVNAPNQQMPEHFQPIQTPPPGAFGLHHLYYPWAVPFHPVSYTPSPGTARLWRADQLLAEWEAFADQGVAGNGVLIGNLLFIISDQAMLGILAYDISPVFETPPRAPQLLDKLSGAIGGYLGPAVWENYLLMAGGANQNQLLVVDYSDPSNLRLSASINLSGTPALDAGSSVPYIQTQDQFVFTRRHKIDMERLEPVLELDEVGGARPAGSVAGELDVSQYLLPLGQFLISGGYSSPGRDGVGVWCHQASPDTRAPYVGYHVPRPDQTHYPVGAPISLVIAETLESFTIINGLSVILRPLGGAPVPAWTSFAHDHILTITPRQHLLPNTTYEVVIPAGGIKDAAGNGIEGYSFRFSTGATAAGGNAAPSITAFNQSASPVTPGTNVEFNTSASDPEGDPLQYRYTFGDGSAATAWSSSPISNHLFTDPGHYDVKVQVRDLKPDGTRATVVDTLVQSVAALPAAPLPTHSSTLALNALTRELWTIDPDNDAMIRLDADTRVIELRIDLRALLGTSQAVHPNSIAISGNGEVWVSAREADRVLVLAASGNLLASISTGYGSAPQALAISRDGSRAFVSLAGRGASDRGNGQLLRFSTSTRAETGRVELGPSAHAIALTGDGNRAFVSRLISREHFGEIWDVNTSSMTLTRTLPLWRDRGADGLDAGGSDGPGVPNYVRGLILSPQQDWLWYAAIKADTHRGLFFRQNTSFNIAAAHDSTVRPVLGRIQINAPGGVPTEPGRQYSGTARTRVDVDNADSPSALVFSPRGDYVFAALQGNDMIAVFDDFAIRAGAGRSSIWRLASAAAPQGLLFDPATSTLWTQNLMDRSLTALPMANFLTRGERVSPATTIATGVTESLSPSVLAGKRLFYFAGNALDGGNEMSFEGYLSCASCHLDGGQDGRVFDFTQRGEGFRNTTTLKGRAGTALGNVHWTGNFDEIQDFVIDIMQEFRGLGFLPGGQLPNPPLGAPNAGRAPALDQLAAYVSSLGTATLPKSPHREAGGALSASAQIGAGHFQSQLCASCHRPESGFTDSTLGNATLHDVGTLRDSSGQRLGQALTGLDTPSLLGAFESPPYFHDGSAATLDEVFAVAGGHILQAESATALGSTLIDDFPQFNTDSSAHGRFVEGIDQVGDGVQFNAVDGDAGGIGAIEVRVLPRSSGTLRLTVNGAVVGTRAFNRQLTHMEWTRIRFEDVSLLAGANNTVRVELASISLFESLGIDEITVSTANDRDRANVHRRVSSMPANDALALKRYLLELDGRDDNGQIPNLIDLFRDGFETP